VDSGKTRNCLLILRRGWLINGLRRVKLMMMALIAPEMLIMWAMRQRKAASNLKEKYHSAFCIFVM
jgi:hypothetical protein